MDISVRIGPDGEKVTYQAAAGQSLVKALWLAPETAGLLTPPSLCSGLGRCGRCKVRFRSPPPPPTAKETRILPQDALDAGWRLACAHDVHDLPHAIDVELPPPPQPVRRMEAPTTKTYSSLLLAVDVGTTSLHWCALDTVGHVIAQGQEINPQMGAGADVMSRLAHAKHAEGRKNLAERVLLALRHIIASLPAPVSQVCVAANTAMTYILLQHECSGLATAPYRLEYSGNTLVALPDLPPVYIPPLPAPFVGGDISAGMAFVQASRQPRYPFVLADMGTNGEFVLALSPRKAYVTSVPLGPALEGMGLTFGGMAGPGAQGDVIVRFSVQLSGITPHMLPPQHNGEAPAAVGTHTIAICATGYLSLLHNLLRVGVLNSKGAFCPQPASPFGQRVARCLYTMQGEQRLALTTDGNLYLTGRDVEEILKVKAAFSLALENLLQATQLQASDLQHIFLAGAFGEHVIADDLEALGILPHGAGARVQAVGNSSLHGAALLLTDPTARDPLARWSADCTVLDLTADPNFTANYMRHMRFA